MRKKISLVIIFIGLAFSLTGFTLMQTNTVEKTLLFEIVYNLTSVYALITLLSISSFVKEKFNFIFYLLLGIFAVFLIYNLINRYKYINYEYSKILVYLLIGILPFFYIKHTLQKQQKHNINYFTIGVIAVVYLGGLLGVISILPTYYLLIMKILFWVLVFWKLSAFTPKKVTTTL